MKTRPNQSLLRNAGRSVHFPSAVRFPAWQTCNVRQRKYRDMLEKADIRIWLLIAAVIFGATGAIILAYGLNLPKGTSMDSLAYTEYPARGNPALVPIAVVCLLLGAVLLGVYGFKRLWK